MVCDFAKQVCHAFVCVVVSRDRMDHLMEFIIAGKGDSGDGGTVVQRLDKFFKREEVFDIVLGFISSFSQLISTWFPPTQKCQCSGGFVIFEDYWFLRTAVQQQGLAYNPLFSAAR